MTTTLSQKMSSHGRTSLCITVIEAIWQQYCTRSGMEMDNNDGSEMSSSCPSQYGSVLDGGDWGSMSVLRCRSRWNVSILDDHRGAPGYSEARIFQCGRPRRSPVEINYCLKMWCTSWTVTVVAQRVARSCTRVTVQDGHFAVGGRSKWLWMNKWT
ncbi:hypothetical protein JOM56_015625 [Amanita muscaria]